VNGSIEYTGTITDVSDRRLKENLRLIDSPIEKITQITGYSYNMIDDAAKKREYGVMAQDVQKVLPEVVSIVDSENGYLGVSYIQLVPVLLEAIKDQQAEIQDLKDKLSKYDALEARIKSLENANSDLNSRVVGKGE
jgi:predicted nuclease with TOPRIM domain